MLKHICPLLQVNDLRASLMFYGEKLGFQTGSAHDGFSVVRRDDCTLYLAQKTKVADVTNRAAPRTQMTVGAITTSIFIASREPWMRCFRSSGAKVF